MLKSLLILLATSVPTFAAVISDTNILLSTDPSATLGTSEYALTIFQDPGATTPTSIFLDHEGANLVFSAANLDEGSDWYFTQLNDTFSASTISQGAFTPFNQVNQSYAVGYGDFYFGVNTGNGFSGMNPGREVFGWALLRNSFGGLQVLGSGVTYDRPGIVVGTTTTVPEPSVSLLLAFAALTAIGSRRGILNAVATRG